MTDRIPTPRTDEYFHPYRHWLENDRDFAHQLERDLIEAIVRTEKAEREVAWLRSGGMVKTVNAAPDGVQFVAADAMRRHLRSEPPEGWQP